MKDLFRTLPAWTLQ